MVFFTCNACGQSIRKSRVEKHWQTECPSCEMLSCMDCGKDFYGEQYSSHTSCITEAEKYQGPLFTGEKGGSTKGEKKQQEWIQCLKQVMSSDDYPPRIKNLMDKISEYPNIPRKKAKFQNFVKNSINERDHVTLDKLWEIFSDATKPKDVKPQLEKKQEECKQVKDDVTKEKSVKEKPIEEEVNDDCEKMTKRKKKKRIREDESCDSHVTSSDAVKVKKRKQHKNTDDEVMVESLECTNESPDVMSVSRKNKKRKKKCSDDDVMLKTGAEENGIWFEDRIGDFKVKKCKH